MPPSRSRNERLWRAGIFILSIAFVYSVTHFFITRGATSRIASIGHYSAVPERTLVLYAYTESEANRMNLEFFLAKALHAKADFVFIFNGPTNDSTLIPNLPNVEVIQRENTCYDLGSFGDVLRQGDRWKNYKHFVTMNASVRGPFFPNFMKPCWTDMLAGRINDGIKLVGTTINCWPRPHLQSQMLATDDVGMSILLDPSLATSLQQEDKWGGKDDPVGLTACFQNRNQAVHSEIGITGLITSQGYGVDVTLSAFDVGSENLTTYCTGEKSEADPLVQGSYFGGSIHPYEVVFMKTNRHITEATMDIMTKWHLERSWSSWDACKL